MISRFVSAGDRDGTGTVGMAVSNEFKLGFCVASVGKRQACQSGQAVPHTAGLWVLQTVDFHIVDVQLCLWPGRILLVVLVQEAEVCKVMHDCSHS